MSTKFLDKGLTFELNNVKKDINNEFLDPNTGKIKSQLLPSNNTAINVFVYTDIDDMYDIPLTDRSEGDISIITNLNQVFITDDTKNYIQISFMDISLSMLTDTNIQNVVNNQVLSYNENTHKWVNKTAEHDKLRDLSDVTVDILTIENNDIICFDSSTQKFISKGFNSSMIKDMMITNPLIDQQLVYSTFYGKWENKTVLKPHLYEIRDVFLLNPQENQTITYDTISSRWRNESIALSFLDDCIIDVPLNNQALIYEAVTNKFKNKNIPITAILNTKGDMLTRSLTNDVRLPIGTPGQVMRVVNGTPSWSTVENIDNILPINIQSPTNYTFLKYSPNSGVWRESLISMDMHLDDVDIINPQNNDVLIYNQTNGLWKNTQNELDKLNDVVITDPSDKEVLIYNESISNFENKMLNTGNLNDMGISNIKNRDLIRYDSSVNKFINHQTSLLEIIGPIHVIVNSDVDRILLYQGTGPLEIRLDHLNLEVGFSWYINSVYQNTYVCIARNLNYTLHGPNVFTEKCKIFKANTNDYIISCGQIFQNTIKIDQLLPSIINASPNNRMNIFFCKNIDQLILQYIDTTPRINFSICNNSLDIIRNYQGTLGMDGFSNIISTSDSSFYHLEYNTGTTMLMIRSIDSYTNIIASSNMQAVFSIVSKNIILNPANNRINIAYLSGNFINIKTYQISNNSIGTITTNLGFSGANSEILMGWHLGYGLIIARTNSSITYWSGTTQGDFSNGMSFGQLFTHTSNKMIFLDYTENGSYNNKFYCLCMTNLGIISILSMNDTKRLYMVDTLPANEIFKNDVITLQSGVICGNYIYIILNNRSSNDPNIYLINIIRYDINKSSFDIITDVFDDNFTNNINKPKGVIGLDRQGGVTIARVKCNTNSNIRTISNPKFD